MKKMSKILTIVMLCVTMITATMLSASAAVVYYHGNDNSAKRCYAKTTQTSTAYSIGAQITWQKSGSNSTTNGDKITSTGYEALSRSSWLWLSSGKSFGYYFISGSQTHKSTAWMSFDF